MSFDGHIFAFLLSVYRRRESLKYWVSLALEKYCQIYFQHGYSNLQNSSCPISLSTLGGTCLLYILAILGVCSGITWWFKFVFLND